MIDEGVQAEIRAAYQELTRSLNLVPRWGQRQMIAEVDAEALQQVFQRAKEAIDYYSKQNSE